MNRGSGGASHLERRCCAAAHRCGGRRPIQARSVRTCDWDVIRAHDDGSRGLLRAFESLCARLPARHCGLPWTVRGSPRHTSARRPSERVSGNQRLVPWADGQRLVHPSALCLGTVWAVGRAPLAFGPLAMRWRTFGTTAWCSRPMNVPSILRNRDGDMVLVRTSRRAEAVADMYKSVL